MAVVKPLVLKAEYECLKTLQRVALPLAGTIPPILLKMPYGFTRTRIRTLGQPAGRLEKALKSHWPTSDYANRTTQSPDRADDWLFLQRLRRTARPSQDIS